MSGFTGLLALPSAHAEPSLDAIIEYVNDLREMTEASLAWDQGSEMTQHAKVALATKMPVCFADPHSLWKCSSNENTTRLYREYSPKGTEIPDHQHYLTTIAEAITYHPAVDSAPPTPADSFPDDSPASPTMLRRIDTTHRLTSLDSADGVLVLARGVLVPAQLDEGRDLGELCLIDAVAQHVAPHLCHISVLAHEVTHQRLAFLIEQGVQAAMAPEGWRTYLCKLCITGHGRGERRPGELNQPVERLRITAQQLQAEHAALGETDGAHHRSALLSDPALDRGGGALQRLRVRGVDVGFEPGVSLHPGMDRAQRGVGEAGRQVGDEADEVALMGAETMQQKHDRRVRLTRSETHHGGIIDLGGNQGDGRGTGLRLHGSSISRGRRDGRR